MPELPEVETVRLGLTRLIIGQKIKDITSDNPKSFPNSESDVSQFVVGSKIIGVRRRAKVLIIDLDSKYSLVIHLKMTGQLVFVGRQQPKNGYRKTDIEDTRSPISDHRSSKSDEVRFGAGHPTSSLIGSLPDRSTRVIITFSDDSVLFFNDQRKFGWMRLIPTIEVENIDFFKKVGPEPLTSEFTDKVFAERLMRRKNSNIKSVLLDQTVLAGVGNIYADESLWGAKIHPSTRVIDIPKSKIKKLHSELIYVLKLSIEKGGSTDRNYVDAEGKKGSYMTFARVFRRENQACPRCGSIIIKTRVAGRGTHVCLKCQKV
jgi:formamidopyrimidine-DNA glycosylase